MKKRKKKDKVSGKDFKDFCEFLNRMVTRLSLRSWIVRAYLRDISPGACASCRTDVEKRTAIVTLNANPGSREAMSRVAAHEVAHIFLAEYAYLARLRGLDLDRLDVEEEKLAVVLEKVLCE